MIRYLQDCVLDFLQRRCQHPGEMVAVDILEGCSKDYEVSYCRRCWAVKINDQEWRLPMPHLWRH